MKIVFLFLFLLFLLGCSMGEKGGQTEEIIQKEAGKMKLTSKDFNEGDMIPSKFTCQGEDINPQLAWDDVPLGVKSFALIFDDPDASAGSWIHWLIKDIPADVREIKQGQAIGTQVVNSFGKMGYGGPCPPTGVHRYFFKLYALDVETFEVSGKADFYRLVENHAISKAELMGKYIKS